MIIAIETFCNTTLRSRRTRCDFFFCVRDISMASHSFMAWAGLFSVNRILVECEQERYVAGYTHILGCTLPGIVINSTLRNVSVGFLFLPLNYSFLKMILFIGIRRKSMKKTSLLCKGHHRMHKDNLTKDYGQEISLFGGNPLRTGFLEIAF